MYTDRYTSDLKNQPNTKNTMKNKKDTLLLAALILSGATVQASQTAFDAHRQNVRGNGAAEVSEVKLSTVTGAVKTSHTINREVRVASDRAELLMKNSSNATESDSNLMTKQTATQKNRNS